MRGRTLFSRSRRQQARTPGGTSTDSRAEDELRALSHRLGLDLSAQDLSFALRLQEDGYVSLADARASLASDDEPATCFIPGIAHT